MTATAPPTTECITTLRCSYEHPDFPKKLCNAVLWRGPVELIETAMKLPLFCERCKRTTQFD